MDNQEHKAAETTEQDAVETQVATAAPLAGGAGVAGEHRRRVVTGTVVSDKSDKTITVLVTRRLRHPLYGKYVKKSKKYYAHDERNEAHQGDIVRVIESRPMSHLKRWKLVEIVKRAV